MANQGERLEAKVFLQRAEQPSSAARSSKLDSTSLGSLREQILRRIMRAGCAVGVASLLAGLLFVRPIDARGLWLGFAGTALVFAVTLLPAKVRVLSAIYPWALVLVGAGLGWLGRTYDFGLLAGGGRVIHWLARARRAAAGVTFANVSDFLGGRSQWSPAPYTPAVGSDWVSCLIAMVSVVLPAAIAGRMLVSVLARALETREALLTNLLEESRAREATLRALESTRTQLTHAQKVELIGQMAGGIAHDMNNALTAVMGETSLLDDRVRVERERILEAAGYAAKLTHQLMVFARRDTSQPRPLDLSASVLGLLQAIRRVIPSEVVLISEIPSDTIAVIADPTQLLQMLLNLVSNAKDAMPEGGRLTLRLSCEHARRMAMIEVSDTGTGMPSQVMARLFEPFFTTKPVGHGTGLGLANVKQLVEGMNGTIEVRSKPGQGSTFQIQIPTTDAPIVVDKRVLNAPTVQPRTGTVLVVDDDVRVRAVVFTALGRLGYHVLEAATPAAALALAREHAGRIDLLLTDVVMTGGGGAAVIEQIRGAFPSVSVLVMSGYNDDETLRRGIAQGGFPFLAKPFTAESLAHAVAGAMSGEQA